MFKRPSGVLHKELKYLYKTVNNFSTILKDTNNEVAKKLQYEYNCMGYAFGWYDWLDLDSFYAIDQDLIEDDEEEAKQDLEKMTIDCVIEIEKHYAVRRIRRPEEATNNERVFAFRCGYDDFHFARLNSDGIWTHKPGGNYIREMTEDELYGDAWCEHRFYPYTSKVYFFAVDIATDIQEEWECNYG